MTTTTDGTKIHLASYTFFLEGKGVMQGQVFADSSYPDLVMKVLKSFEHWCETSFNVKSVEVAKTDEGEGYKFTITHPSWTQPFVEWFFPQSSLKPVRKLLLHVVENTMIDGDSVANKWADDNWMSDVTQHLNVVESSYTLV